jgi:hypothetical protein
MAQKRIVVGTNPVLLADFNKNRKSISIIMLPTSIETGNTGRVHVGKGFPPSNNLGDPNQGDPLIQGQQITEQEQFPGDPTVFKGQWWARASIENQVLVVDEITEV